MRGLNFIFTPADPDGAPALPLRVGASLKGVERALPASLGVDLSAAVGALSRAGAGAEPEPEPTADDPPAADDVRAAETRFGLRTSGLDGSDMVGCALRLDQVRPHVSLVLVYFLRLALGDRHLPLERVEARSERAMSR